MSYLVGTFTVPNSGYQNFLWQASTISVEADEYEAKNEQGQTEVLVATNHRVKISLDAIIPGSATVPVPGQTVDLKGVAAPTVVVSGGITTVSSGLSYGSGNTIMGATVTGTPQITESNTDFIKASFEVTKHVTVTSSTSSSGTP